MVTPTSFFCPCIHSPVPHKPTGDGYEHCTLRSLIFCYGHFMSGLWLKLASSLLSSSIFMSLTSVLAFNCRIFPAPVSFSSHVQKVVTAVILSLCISPSVYKPTKSPKWACISPRLANGILRNFVRGGFFTKLKYKLNVQSKSENAQRSPAVQKVRGPQQMKLYCLQNILDLQFYPFSITHFCPFFFFFFFGIVHMHRLVCCLTSKSFIPDQQTQQ